MVDYRQRLRTMDRINQQSTKNINHQISHTVWWRWSHFPAPDLSRDIDAFVSDTTTTKQNDRLSRQSMQLSQKWTDHDRKHRQNKQGNHTATGNFKNFRSYETKSSMCHCCIWSTRGDIDYQSWHVDGAQISKLPGKSLPRQSKGKSQFCDQNIRNFFVSGFGADWLLLRGLCWTAFRAIELSFEE